MVIAICDDEQFYREGIRKACGAILSEANVDYLFFESGEAFLQTDKNVDLLFLDIEMQDMDGIEVKDRLEQLGRKTRIVFITGHDERMQEAFGERVIGFVKKPVSELAVKQVIRRFLCLKSKRKVEWEEAGVFYSVNAEDIDYVEAQDKYTYVVFEQGQYLVRRTMREWERLLPEDEFCRVSRSFLVNLKLIEKVGGELSIRGKKILISRKAKPLIWEKYKQYIRKKAGEIK